LYPVKRAAGGLPTSRPPTRRENELVLPTAIADPFGIKPLRAKAIDSRRVEVDADKDWRISIS
jgi:hypothetical protein